MPELRKDPVIGRWVIIATERARRPGNFVTPSDHQLDQPGKPCPFCHLHEKPFYTCAHGRPSSQTDWDVCVVPHLQPILQPKADYNRHGHGLYDVMGGYGSHEVVIETPKHIANMVDLSEDHIRLAIDTYAHRMAELEKNPHFQYVLAYKNFGVSAGSRRIGHARSHIIAAPVNPRRVKDKLVGAKKYFEVHDRCIYCDLITTELNDKKRIIAESEHFIAFIPFAARFLFETMILPKNHHCDFYKGVIHYQEDLSRMLKLILMKLKVGLDDPAYNFLIHTAPFRRPDQHPRKWRTLEEDYHWHIEIFPRLTRVAGFEKGSGFYICTVPPENMAEFLRKADVHV